MRETALIDLPTGAAQRLAQRLALVWHVTLDSLDEIEAAQIIEAHLRSEWNEVAALRSPEGAQGGA